MAKMILVIEDETAIQNVIRAFLEDAGYTVVLASDGLEGIRQAAQQVAGLDCDLVVLDCIGYTLEMKQIFAQATGKNIVLSRTLLARVVSELID